MVAEHDNVKLQPSTLHTITAASQIGGDITCLVVGCQCSKVSELCIFLATSSFGGKVTRTSRIIALLS